MRTGQPSIAARVRIERAKHPGLSDADIAEIVGCTAKYVAWVAWGDKNRESRRRYERDRKREVYHSDPDAAERMRKSAREWNRAKRARELAGANAE